MSTPHTPENLINRYQFVAEALSSPQVNPKEYPEALSYLKSGYPVHLARFDATGMVVLSNTFKALAAAGDSQASELGRQTIEAATETLGTDYTFWIIYTMLNDRRTAKAYIPARTIRHVLEKTPTNSIMPLLLIPALATAEYTSAVKMELLDAVDEHIRDPLYKLITYFSMALSDLKDSEIKAKLDQIGKDPALATPMTSMLGLAVANIRPSLYPNVFQRMQLLERGARSNPGAWLGMKVAVLCDAKISAVTRRQYWNRWLSDPGFDTDAIDLLGPSIVETAGIRNFGNYLDLLGRLVKHPKFTPELQKSYLEDLDEKDETELFSSSKFELTDDQKNQIRQILSRPKSGGQ